MGRDFFCNDRDSKATRVFKIIGAVIGGIIIAILFAFIFGYVVKYLWNWLMPTIFHLPLISYWQAFGIVILAKILFSGFGKHTHNHGFKKARYHMMHEEFSKHMGIDCREDWRHYHDFWKDEGKKAFEDYLKRVKEEEK